MVGVGGVEEAGRSTEVLRPWVDRTLRAFAKFRAERGPSVLHLTRLSNKAAREELSMDLLASLAPEAADPELWLDWLEGGHSPSEQLTVKPFSEGEAGSGRKIKSALTHVQKAEEQVAGKRKQLERAVAEAKRLDEELRSAEANASLARDQARGAVTWALFRQVASSAATVFAMGPAWSLMRIVSGHLHEDGEWESGLDDDLRAAVAEHRQTRKERSRQMLQQLEARRGDSALEIRLFEHLASFFEEEPVSAVTRGGPARGLAETVPSELRDVARAIRRS